MSNTNQPSFVMSLLEGMPAFTHFQQQSVFRRHLQSHSRTFWLDDPTFSFPLHLVFSFLLPSPHPWCVFVHVPSPLLASPEEHTIHHTHTNVQHPLAHNCHTGANQHLQGCIGYFLSQKSIHPAVFSEMTLADILWHKIMRHLSLFFTLPQKAGADTWNHFCG